MRRKDLYILYIIYSLLGAGASVQGNQVRSGILNLNHREFDG